MSYATIKTQHILQTNTECIKIRLRKDKFRENKYIKSY